MFILFLLSPEIFSRRSWTYFPRRFKDTNERSVLTKERLCECNRLIRAGRFFFERQRTGWGSSPSFRRRAVTVPTHLGERTTPIALRTVGWMPAVKLGEEYNAEVSGHYTADRSPRIGVLLMRHVIRYRRLREND
jgi:hypothetical protein